MKETNFTHPNNLSQTPAEIDISSEIPSQRNWANLRRISDRQSLENSPGNTTQDLGDLEIDDVLCGEEDGCECDNESQAGHDRVSVSEALGNVTIDEKTDDLADIGTLVDQQTIFICRMKNSRYSNLPATSQEPDTFHLSARTLHISY